MRGASTSKTEASSAAKKARTDTKAPAPHTRCPPRALLTRRLTRFLHDDLRVSYATPYALLTRRLTRFLRFLRDDSRHDSAGWNQNVFGRDRKEGSARTQAGGGVTPAAPPPARDPHRKVNHFQSIPYGPRLFLLGA
eukprot:1180853-Prorocentrum_minimum.AAC.5